MERSNAEFLERIDSHKASDSPLRKPENQTSPETILPDESWLYRASNKRRKEYTEQHKNQKLTGWLE